MGKGKGRHSSRGPAWAKAEAEKHAEYSGQGKDCQVSKTPSVYRVKEKQHPSNSCVQRIKLSLEEEIEVYDMWICETNLMPTVFSWDGLNSTPWKCSSSHWKKRSKWTWNATTSMTRQLIHLWVRHSNIGSYGLPCTLIVYKMPWSKEKPYRDTQLRRIPPVKHPKPFKVLTSYLFSLSCQGHKDMVLGQGKGHLHYILFSLWQTDKILFQRFKGIWLLFILPGKSIH